MSLDSVMPRPAPTYTSHSREDDSMYPAASTVMSFAYIGDVTPLYHAHRPYSSVTRFHSKGVSSKGMRLHQASVVVLCASEPDSLLCFYLVQSTFTCFRCQHEADVVPRCIGWGCVQVHQYHDTISASQSLVDAAHFLVMIPHICCWYFCRHYLENAPVWRLGVVVAKVVASPIKALKARCRTCWEHCRHIYRPEPVTATIFEPYTHCLHARLSTLL